MSFPWPISESFDQVQTLLQNCKHKYSPVSCCCYPRLLLRYHLYHHVRTLSLRMSGSSPPPLLLDESNLSPTSENINKNNISPGRCSTTTQQEDCVSGVFVQCTLRIRVVWTEFWTHAEQELLRHFWCLRLPVFLEEKKNFAVFSGFPVSSSGRGAKNSRTRNLSTCRCWALTWLGCLQSAWTSTGLDERASL